jgi:hypothetical protein
LVGRLLLIVMHEVSKGETSTARILLIIACFAFMGLLMKKWFFNMVDEVLDAGDAFLIRNGRLEERIVLSEIITARFSGLSPVTVVFLTLSRQSVFGTRVISFALPPGEFRVIEELFERIDTARKTAPAIANQMYH